MWNISGWCFFLSTRTSPTTSREARRGSKEVEVGELEPTGGWYFMKEGLKASTNPPNLITASSRKAIKLGIGYCFESLYYDMTPLMLPK